MVKWQIHLDLSSVRTARGSSTSSTTSRLPFGDEYEISVVLTALPFHHNAFYAMQHAGRLIRR